MKKGSKRMRTRKKGDTPALEMTPMIDVVFQLLIFFIVTLKKEDILSHLDINRPAPDPNAKKEEQPEDLLNILVFKDGFVLNGKNVTKPTLDKALTKLASFSRNISVIIRCTGDSPHMYLMEVLDICARVRLTNLNVFSM